LIPGIPSIPGVLTGTITPAASAKDKSDLTAALGQAVVNANAARARLAAAPGPQPAIPEDKCKEFTAKVQMVVANSELIAKTIKGESDLLTTANDQYKKFLTETDKTFSQGNRTARIAFAKKLCASATAVLPKLKAVATIDFDAFSKSLKLDVFAANVTLLDDGLSSSNCADTALLKKVIDGLKLDVANYKTKVDDLRKAIADSQKSLETPTKIIKAALGSSGSFAEAAYAPSLGDATSVSVAITRKNLRDENPKDEVVAVSRPIEIGEPRVVLSGGIGFSTINERKISRQVSCT